MANISEKHNSMKVWKWLTTSINVSHTSLSLLFFGRSLTGEVTSSDAPDASSDSPSEPIRGFSCTTPAKLCDLAIKVLMITFNPTYREYLLFHFSSPNNINNDKSHSIKCQQKLWLVN